MTLTIVLCSLLAILSVVNSVSMMRQLEQQRKEFTEERSKLLDRIQAGSFIEYKAQERADTTPLKRREKDPLMEKLEAQPWL